MIITKTFTVKMHLYDTKYVLSQEDVDAEIKKGDWLKVRVKGESNQGTKVNVSKTKSAKPSVAIAKLPEETVRKDAMVAKHQIISVRSKTQKKWWM